ncbi:MAG: hypothetical protein ACRC92_11455, partial [Peptostreptococcaceae bacterium]
MIFIIKNIIYAIVTFIAIIPLLTNFFEKQYILMGIYGVFFIYILNPLIVRIIKNEKVNSYIDK